MGGTKLDINNLFESQSYIARRDLNAIISNLVSSFSSSRDTNKKREILFFHIYLIKDKHFEDDFASVLEKMKKYEDKVREQFLSLVGKPSMFEVGRKSLSDEAP